MERERARWAGRAGAMGLLILLACTIPLAGTKWDQPGTNEPGTGIESQGRTYETLLDLPGITGDPFTIHVGSYRSPASNDPAWTLRAKEERVADATSTP